MDEKGQARFELGTCLLLQRWDQLTAAVDNEWGGPDSSMKRDWMAGCVTELFECKSDKDPDVEPEDIEDRLLQMIEDEFLVHVEDNSAYEVALAVIKVYHECKKGYYESVDTMYKIFESRQQASGAPVKSRELVEQDASDSSDEDEDEDEDDESDVDIEPSADPQPDPRPDPGPIVDEDGFELVQPKRKPNRR